MSQKKPLKEYSMVAGGILIVILGSLAMRMPLRSPALQGRENPSEAEAGDPERRGDTTQHRDVVDDSELGGREDLRLRNVTYYTYDSMGRRTAMERYDSDGALFKYEHIFYDQQGNRVREQSETPGLGWETYREVRYTYDEENRLILEQNYDGYILSSEYYFQYSPDGSTHSVVQNYDKSGQKSFWSTTNFNENGDPVTEYHYDKEGQVTSCNKYRYDEEGRQIYYIFYNRGDETTTPLREVFTEYGDEQTVRVSYEPPGHLNSVHYVKADEATKTEMYYLAGYSGGSGGNELYILGQEEHVWNRKLRFWEGLWQTYLGEDKISSFNCSFDRLHSYEACWYEEANKIRELECSVNGGICITTMKRYVYQEDGRLAECYEYGFSGESLEEELQDGTRIRLEYDDSKLVRLLCTASEGTVLRELTFDTENYDRIEEWYEPRKDQQWAESLILTEDGIVSVEQEVGQDQEPSAGREEIPEEREEETESRTGDEKRME